MHKESNPERNKDKMETNEIDGHGLGNCVESVRKNGRFGGHRLCYS